MKKKVLNTYINNKEWDSIYSLENRINNIIINVYNGNIIVRCEIYDLLTIKTQFKILSNMYECIISKRNNDYGFTVYNIDNPFKYSDLALNKTIINNKLYLYNIYKILFRVLEI
jgi:hypothetical protein